MDVDVTRETTEAAMLLLELASMPREARAASFRRQVHRVFEPGFLPATLIMAKSMAESQSDESAVLDDKSAVIVDVLATILMETSRLFDSIGSDELSPQAQGNELFFAALAAELNGENRPAAVGSVYRRRALSHRDKSRVTTQLDRIAAVAVAFGAAHADYRQIADAFGAQKDELIEFLSALDIVTAAMETPSAASIDAGIARLSWKGKPQLLGAAVVGAFGEDSPHLALLLERLLVSGLGVDRQAIADYLTRMGSGPDAEMAPHEVQLAELGPLVVGPALEIAAEKLGHFSEGFEDAFVGAWSDIFVRVVFQHIGDLVAELLAKGSPISDTTSTVLATALGHHDPDVRRLAGIMCMLNGVNEGLLTHALRLAFEQDDDLLLRVIAVVALSGFARIPAEVTAAADPLVRLAAEMLDDPERDDTPPQASLLPGRLYLLLRAPIWIGRDRARRSRP